MKELVRLRKDPEDEAFFQVPLEYLLDELDWALTRKFFWNTWILPKETVSGVIQDIRNEIEVGNVST